MGARRAAGAPARGNRDRRDPRAAARGPGDARLPLRARRGQRAQAALHVARDPRGRARPAAAAPCLRRHPPGRPSGHAHRPRELWPQEGRDTPGLRADRRASDAAQTPCSNTSTTSPRATSSICGPSRATTTRIAARPWPSSTGCARQAPADVDWLAAADGARADAEPHEPSERELLREELVAGEPEGSERWLAGELLAYHSRAAKQQWWAYFQRKEMSREQLLADAEVLAGLELLTDRDPTAVDRVTRASDAVPATGPQDLDG